MKVNPNHGQHPHAHTRNAGDERVRRLHGRLEPLPLPEHSDHVRVPTGFVERVHEGHGEENGGQVRRDGDEHAEEGIRKNDHTHTPLAQDI